MRGMLDRRELLQLGVAAAAPVVLGVRPGWAAAPAAVALVTADAEAHVAVVGLAARRVVARIRTVEDPRSVERSPDGRWAIVGHAGAGAISLLDLRERRVRRGLPRVAEPPHTPLAAPPRPPPLDEPGARPGGPRRG